MEIVIRGRASYRRLALRATVGVFAIGVSGPALAASASYHDRVVVGAYFVPDNYRITEDGEVRITEDGEARIVDG